MKQQPKLSPTYYICGLNAALAAIANPNREICAVFLSPARAPEIRAYIAKFHFRKSLIDKLVITADKDLSLLLPRGSSHQGIVLDCKPLKQPNLNEFLSTLDPTARVAILDEANDPQNVGAIVRSALAFDIDGLIVTSHNGCGEGSGVAKAACGALEKLPIISVTNLSRTIDKLKDSNFWVCGFCAHTKGATYLNQLQTYDRLALVFGSEGKGLRPSTLKACDITSLIPFNSQKVESLNLSNAAAIVFFSLRKLTH